jgi:signal transduction histidine kinase
MTEAGRGSSIERRLPLLMSAVLVVVLATSLVLTYRTLAVTARSTAAERLRQVARLLATSAEQNTRGRTASLVRTARDSTLVRILRDASTATAPVAPALLDTARLILRRVEQPSDSGLPTMLVTADGRQIADIGAASVPVERSELSPASMPAVGGRDSVETTAPFEAGGRVYYYMYVPVREHDATLGHVLLLRRVANNPMIAAQLRDLTGEQASLFLHQPGSPLWASSAGVPSRPPERLDSGLVSRGAGGPRLTVTTRIRGTPWLVTLEEPVSAVLERPRGVVRRLALLSVLLTLAGAGASWAIGRRIARPLTQLTAAAESIARGDYRSRVPEHYAAEVGRLARSFNVMTGEVDASQRELARQYGEARTVADELERSNRQLHTAVRAVEEARDAAEHANRAKSDFLAVMSHELRTPLNAIGGYTELMQMGIYGSVTDEQHRALARVTRSQQHLLGLINDVLNFAKLNAAKVQFDIDEVPLRDVVAHVEPMIAPQLEAKALRYSCTLTDPTLVAYADAEKLQQILLNLLSNAVKFTAEGGSVAIECSRDGNNAHIAVRDTGVGIPPERLAHIFEPFVQVDRALNRPHEGVGLGLAISHELALGMGGMLLVESTPGEGSAFTVVLPVARGVSAERRSQSAERLSAG